MLEYPGGAAGMVRLALVDLTERGQQPIWSADRRVAILFNGEMYNFRTERARLADQGHAFQSHTDTEVALQLYLEQGLEFVHRLRGMYALAIFDWRTTGKDQSPELIFARDPLGIKPLYIAQPDDHPNNSSVAFASELRTLLASGLVARQVDRQSLVDYLSYGFVPQPRTILQGVRMMEAGTLEQHSPGRPVRTHKFWSMPAYEPHAESLDQAAERLRAVLDDSVNIHAMADARVGAFLSGGVDSTGVVGLMRWHIPDLRTYTLRFPDISGQDESEYAISAAQRFDCRNTVVDVTSSDVRNALPRFARDLDQPSADGLNTWLISQAAAQDCKAVLSGLGGDEWFAGYPIAGRLVALDRGPRAGALRMAGSVANHLRNLAPSGMVPRRLHSLAARRSLVARWVYSHHVFERRSAAKIAGSSKVPSQLGDVLTTLTQVRADWRDETAVGLSCLLDARIYMMSQLLRDADAASMAHSLELRVPLVDLGIVEFSRSCNDAFKLSSLQTTDRRYETSGAKRVLIRAFGDILPSDIGNRPKRGFALPHVHWMTHDLQPLVRETAERAGQRGLIDPQWVPALFGTNGARRVSHYPQLWALLILELWAQQVLDAPASAPSKQPQPVTTVIR